MVIGTAGGMAFQIMSIPSYDAIDLQSDNPSAAQSPHVSADAFCSFVVASQESLDTSLVKNGSGRSTTQEGYHSAVPGGDETSQVQCRSGAEDVCGEALVRKITLSLMSLLSTCSLQPVDAANIDGGDESIHAGRRVVTASQDAGGEAHTRVEDILERSLPDVTKNQEKRWTGRPGHDEEADQSDRPGLSASTAGGTDLQEVPSAVTAHVSFTTGETQGWTPEGENVLGSVSMVPSHPEMAPLPPTTPPNSGQYAGAEEHKAPHSRSVREILIAAADIESTSARSADRSDNLRVSPPPSSSSFPMPDQGDGGELAALVMDRDNTVRRTEPNAVTANESAAGDEVTAAETSADAGLPRIVRRFGETDVVTQEHGGNAELAESPSPLSGVTISEIHLPASSTTEGPRVNHPAAPSAVTEPVRSMAESPSDVTVVRRSDTSLEVRMTVEGIGEVDVEVVLDNGAITGRVSTSDVIGKELIERNLSQLLDALSREGLNVGGFSVSLRKGRNMAGAGPYEHGATTQVQAETVVTTHRGIGHTISLFV